MSVPTQDCHRCAISVLQILQEAGVSSRAGRYANESPLKAVPTSTSAVLLAAGQGIKLKHLRYEDVD